jgi:ATP/maltotriose-dependent transcriptional regulator MalT
MARELDERAEQVAAEFGLQENAYAMAGLEALWEAQAGNRELARRRAKVALAHSHGIDVAVFGAMALAATGDNKDAAAIADRLAQDHPQDTLVATVSVPLIRSSIELAQGNAAKAIDLLRASQPYELGFGFLYYPPFMPPYMRGEAYLQLHDSTRATAEFRKVLNHPGLDPASPTYALAHLGLARAQAMGGNVTAARAGYQDLFTVWKDADPEIPIYRQAKAEYATLQ